MKASLLITVLALGKNIRYYHDLTHNCGQLGIFSFMFHYSWFQKIDKMNESSRRKSNTNPLLVNEYSVLHSIATVEFKE